MAKKKRARKVDVRSASGGNQTKSTSFRGHTKVVSSARAALRSGDMNAAKMKRYTNKKK